MSEKIISLVTGGCGFIGHHLCKKLLKLGHKVVVVDNLSTGKKHNEIIDTHIKYVYGDINNIECVSFYTYWDAMVIPGFKAHLPLGKKVPLKVFNHKNLVKHPTAVNKIIKSIVN